MIREATIQDAARTAEIDAVSSVYAYQAILPEEILKDLSAEKYDGMVADARRFFDDIAARDPEETDL